MYHRTVIPATMQAFAVVALTCAIMPSPWAADAAKGKGRKTASYFRLTATAGQPDAGGRQSLTVTLDIDKRCYLFANPVGFEELEPSRLALQVSAASKVLDTEVTYPPGETYSDNPLGEYKVYRSKVTIRAAVRRAPGQAGPLEVQVQMHGVLLSGIF
jgi:hypothetical protein